MSGKARAKRGVLYCYVEALTISLRNGDGIVIEVNCGRDSIDIETRMDSDVFTINKTMQFPMRIIIDESGAMQEEYIVLRVVKITEAGDRRRFADLAINVKKFFGLPTMCVERFEARAKTAERPVFTLALAVRYLSDSKPVELARFAVAEDGKQENTGKVPVTPTKSPVKMAKKPEKKEVKERELVGKHIEMDSEDSDAMFDADITLQSVQLAKTGSSEGGLEECIVRNWFDLSKSEIGRPGYVLANALPRKGDPKSASHIDKVFAMLEDVRTTTRNAESAIRFYSASLCFYYMVSERSGVAEPAKELVYHAIDTAVVILGSELQKVFMAALPETPGTPGFDLQLDAFRAKIARFTVTGLKFLLNAVIDHMDCVLSNAFVTHNTFNTLSKVVNANNAIAAFETAFGIKFSRFRQVLLTVTAHDKILDDHQMVKRLTPLVPPTFAYFAMCLIKPDELLPKPIDYRQIEKFAIDMNVNFSVNMSVDLMFQRERLPLPASCPEFQFE